MNKYVEEILKPYEWCETGSRFYGNNHNESDWDYVIYGEPDYVEKHILDVFSTDGWIVSQVSDNFYTFGKGYTTVYLLTNLGVEYSGHRVLQLTFVQEKKVVQLIIENDYAHFNNWKYLSLYFRDNIDTIVEACHDNMEPKYLFNIIRNYCNRYIYSGSLFSDYSEYIENTINVIRSTFNSLK